MRDNNVTHRRNYLPEEIIIEVLSRLPAKYVLRFKSVCKSWCAVIDSKSFINSHLETFGTVMESHCHLICNVSYPNPKLPVLNAAILSGPTQKIEDLVGAPCLDPEILGRHLHGRYMYPWNIQRSREHDGVDEEAEKSYLSKMWGPINGVYCIMMKYRFSGSYTILLWNPGNRQVHIPPPIPPPLLPAALQHLLQKENRGRYMVCGFGYDFSVDDYKVLAITLHEKLRDIHHHFYYFHLYSLASNSWKQLDPYEIFSNHPFFIVTSPHGGVALRECLQHAQQGFSLTSGCHWLFRNLHPESWTILSFDFVSEKFRVTDLPREVTNQLIRCKLSAVDDCLALVGELKESVKSDGAFGFDVYKIRDDGAEDMWTRGAAYRITLSLFPGRFLGIVDDEFIVQEVDGDMRILSHRLGSPDPNEYYQYCSKECDARLASLPYIGSILPYRGSLVPVKPRLL